MIILPNSDPQTITFRCRPHNAQDDYVVFAWNESNKIYPIFCAFIYGDGYLSGTIAVPIAKGLVNGSKVTVRVFPVVDLELVTEAVEALRDEAPYFGTSEAISDLIEQAINDDEMLPEVFRGQIFVSNRTEQPYNIT